MLRIFCCFGVFIRSGQYSIDLGQYFADADSIPTQTDRIHPHRGFIH